MRKRIVENCENELNKTKQRIVYQSPKTKTTITKLLLQKNAKKNKTQIGKLYVL